MKRLLPRLWQYQKERFPLFGYALMIGSFTVSAATYSRICRGVWEGVDAVTLLIGALSAFGFFLLLRLFDEFKDAREDACYRPYRPVPRGLVSFCELKVLVVIVIALIVLGNAVWVPRMIGATMLVLGYMVLMRYEFGIGRWLRNHPLAYMLSHMAVMPVIDFYTTGLDWINAALPLPRGIELFLLTTFVNGCVIEIGRKIRPLVEEEKGVKTYSVLWGMHRALRIWIGVLTLTAFLSGACCFYAGYGMWALPPLVTGWVLCGGYALSLYRRAPLHNKLEEVCGCWTIFIYLLIGVYPLALRGLGYV